MLGVDVLEGLVVAEFQRFRVYEVIQVAIIHYELFGRSRYATITGLLAPFRMIGGVVGPIFAGYIFDVYGSYRLAFHVFTVMALLSSVTFQFVRPWNRDDASGDD